jgi:hypothetical protein
MASTEAQVQQQQQQPVQNKTETAEQQVNLLDIEVKDENTALNVMVSFLNAAQRRGAFSMPESSKLWECVKVFQRVAPPQESATTTQ